MASLILTGMCFWRWGCYSKFRWVLCISLFLCSKPMFALHVNELFLVIFQLTNGSTMRSREEKPAGRNMEMWLHSFTASIWFLHITVRSAWTGQTGWILLSHFTCFSFSCYSCCCNFIVCCCCRVIVALWKNSDHVKALLCFFIIYVVAHNFRLDRTL